MNNYEKGLEDIKDPDYSFILEELGDSEELRQKVLREETIHYEDDLENRFNTRIGRHEAMDRAFIQAENVEAYLVNHPSITLDPKAFNLALIAQSALYALYQRIPNIARDLKSI